MQVDLPKNVFILHVGIFFVWFPLVFGSQRAIQKRTKPTFTDLLSVLPKSAGLAIGLLFFYAIAHFLYFIHLTQQYPKHQVPLWLEVRGFSGHWMMFYGTASLGLLALHRRASASPRIPEITQ